MCLLHNGLLFYSDTKYFTYTTSLLLFALKKSEMSGNKHGCKLKPHLIHFEGEELKSVQRHGIFTLYKQLFFDKGAVTAQCKLTPIL